MGCTWYDTDNYYTRPFLTNVAKRISKNVWVKKNTQVTTSNVPVELAKPEPTQDDIKKAIDLLKAKGYKVMMPKTEWQEL